MCSCVPETRFLLLLKGICSVERRLRSMMGPSFVDRCDIVSHLSLSLTLVSRSRYSRERRSSKTAFNRKSLDSSLWRFKWNVHVCVCIAFYWAGRALRVHTHIGRKRVSPIALFCCLFFTRDDTCLTDVHSALFDSLLFFLPFLSVADALAFGQSFRTHKLSFSFSQSLSPSLSISLRVSFIRGKAYRERWAPISISLTHSLSFFVVTLFSTHTRNTSFDIKAMPVLVATVKKRRDENFR